MVVGRSGYPGGVGIFGYDARYFNGTRERAKQKNRRATEYCCNRRR